MTMDGDEDWGEMGQAPLCRHPKSNSNPRVVQREVSKVSIRIMQLRARAKAAKWEVLQIIHWL